MPTCLLAGCNLLPSQKKKNSYFQFNIIELKKFNYAAIKNDEFLSFVGTWMSLETIILRKLTQEQNIKHHMFSLIGRCWSMRTHGHREGSITHWGLLWGNTGRDNGGYGGCRGITWEEMSDTDDGDGGSKPHCHVCTYAAILHVLYMCHRN